MKPVSETNNQRLERHRGGKIKWRAWHQRQWREAMLIIVGVANRRNRGVRRHGRAASRMTYKCIASVEPRAIV